MTHSILAISEQQAEAWAKQYFEIEVQAKRLAGEEDYNFLLKSKDGKKYLLKVSRNDADLDQLVFQSDLLKHLAQSNLALQVPKVIPNLEGEDYVTLEGQQYIRLHEWVPGRMLADVKPRSKNLLQSWGETCGLLSKHLQDFDHPAAHRFYKWNPSETLYSKQHRTLFTQEEGAIADYFWTLFEESVQPQLASLRKSVNYNDAHEHNLLVGAHQEDARVTGVIDFGDALYTETINELAIACAYAGMGMPDPLAAMAELAHAYHKVFPLEEKEVAVLFPLIAARLMITVASAAYNKQQEPDNEYLVISERPAWDLLRKLRSISPNLAQYVFRSACGWMPVPQYSRFESWLEKSANQIVPVVDYKGHQPVPLDLSVASLGIGNNADFDTIQPFNATIERIMLEKEAEFGIGGYGEVRPFYSTDAYQVEGNQGAQWRTVHMGIDIWTDAETAVYAPLAGVVHSLGNNAAERDYGPTIVLQHQVEGNLTFYTLYGHLSLASIENLKVGQAIKPGQQIATLGAPPVNGNWPPHLHFQVMLDMLGNDGDFPGVAFPDEWAVWQQICPEPSAFVKSPVIPSSSSKSLDALLNKRRAALGKSLSISYQRPLHMVRGYMQHLFDTNARRYLDTVNNVAHVGHEHPKVVRAAQRQMAVLNTNTRYLHQNLIEFAEDLLSALPPELSVVHFVNSGSEANELAIRMAETFTSQKDMLAVEIGYHGNTGRCVEVSSYKFDGKGGQGAPAHTHIVPMPDTYRGLYRDPKEAGGKYATHVQEKINAVQASGKQIAGFIHESILSCGGQIVLPEGYLKQAYEMVRTAGGLCIADEVQTGFGRVGDRFWSFELQGVVPDIVTMGKPIGNGHPLGAVVCTREVADAFANGMEFFNTFGGNPVSCAIGKTVLQIVKAEGLQEQAKEVGTYLLAGLKDLQHRFPIIGDVRGHGLFLGFELVKDRETLAPAAEAASYLANRMRERAILMSTDGPLHNVIKIKPPMCFDKGNVDVLLQNLEIVFKEDKMMKF